MRASTSLLLVGLGLLVALGSSQPASAQTAHCDIPREARDIWRCENGFVVGPENVIIRLPIPETDPEALYNAGIEAAGREDWRVAIAYFTAAHQRAHLVPRYMYNLGLAHARAGNEVAAIAWLSAFLVAEPTAPNRSAVWAQIAALEANLRRKRATIQDALYYATIASGNDLSLRNAPVPAPTEVAPPADDPLYWHCERGLHPYLDRLIYICGRGTETPFDDQLREAIRRGDRRQTEALLSGWTYGGEGLDWTGVASALRGRVSEAQSRIAGLGRGFLGELKEGLASEVGEVLLRLGDVRGARQFAQFSQQMAELERRQARSEGQGGLISGFLAARLHALVLAEQGDAEAAIEWLTIYISRRLTTWWTIDEAHSPDSLWLRYESAARLHIAAYLFDRGRQEQALAVAAALDSHLKLPLLAGFAARASELGNAVAARAIEAARAEALRAAGGSLLDGERRQHVQESVRIAVVLPGVSYNLDWWLRAAARGDFANSGRWRGTTTISPDILILALAGLGRGHRAVRAAYERTGGTWGQ